MSKCIAITKAGHQCKFNKNGKLFCGRHIKSTPEQVMLEGVDITSAERIINYIDEVGYFKTIEDIKHKQIAKNKVNDIRAQYNHAKIITWNAAVSLPPTGDSDLAIDLPTNIDNRFAMAREIITTCGVCFDDIVECGELIECSSGSCYLTHLVCKGCLLGHITSMLNDGIADNNCMFDKSDKCGGWYSELDIQKAIGLENQEMLAKWNDTLISCEIVKLAGVCDNYLICPLCCRWGCIFDAPAGAGNRHAFYIPCGKCGEQWCTLCKRRAHDARSCYNLQFNAEDSRAGVRETVIDKMLQDIVTRTLTHCCSICGCTYIKEEGCNLMTCPKCN